MGVRTPSVEQRLLFYGDKGKFLLDKVKGGGFLEQVEGGKFILDTKPNFFMVYDIAPPRKIEKVNEKTGGVWVYTELCVQHEIHWREGELFPEQKTLDLLKKLRDNDHWILWKEENLDWLVKQEKLFGITI